MPGIRFSGSQVKNRQREQQAAVRTIFPPILGLNTKDPLQAMDPRYSPEMRNWIPDGTKLVGRGGCETFYTGTEEVRFLHGHNSANGKALLIGEAGKLFEATDASTSTELISGVSSDWVADDISNSTILVNGVDFPR